MLGSNAPHLLSLIGHELDAVEAKWTTIGALDVAYHGLVRVSLDADALVSFKTAKVSAEAFAAQLGQQELQVEYREGEAGVLASNRDHLDRDLLTAISHRFGRTTENRCRKLLMNGSPR